MPNINTALVSLWSKAAKTTPSYILMLIFCAFIFAIFSQRLLGIQSQYYIVLATALILFLMIFVMTSLFASDPRIMDNWFFNGINQIFDNPGSRNFMSVVSLILFTMLVYELVEYDNNDPDYFLDKVMFGNNKYISNRASGLIVILGFGMIVAYTIMRTTRG